MYNNKTILLCLTLLCSSLLSAIADFKIGSTTVIVHSDGKPSQLTPEQYKLARKVMKKAHIHHKERAVIDIISSQTDPRDVQDVYNRFDNDGEVIEASLLFNNKKGQRETMTALFCRRQK